eukprot:1945297-Amphidinium_carterae.2
MSRRILVGAFKGFQTEQHPASAPDVAMPRAAHEMAALKPHAGLISTEVEAIGVWSFVFKPHES